MLKAEVGRVVMESVQALSRAADIVPEAGARALGSIGTAALAEGRPEISAVATNSLLRSATRVIESSC